MIRSFGPTISTTLLFLLGSSSCLMAQFKRANQDSKPKSWFVEEGGSELNPVELPSRTVQERLRVRWFEPEIDQLGRSCTIAGELYDPETELTITWRQPITVAIDRNEDKKGANSKLGDRECIERECIKTESSGKFRAIFDIRGIERDVGKAQVLSVYVAVGTQNVNVNEVTTRWSSEDPLLGLDQETLEIPANPKLDRIQFLLNEAGKHEHSYQPAPIIRAINALHGLGKQKAVSAIEEHLKMLREGDQRSSGEDDHVFTILRVLFEPVDPTTKFPVPRNFSASVDGEVEKEWPLNPVVLVAGIPFKYHRSMGGSGTPEIAASHLEFVKQSCVLRERPLKPTLNPIQAAEVLCDSQKIRLLDRKYSRPEAIDAIREQAISMLPKKYREQEWSSVRETAGKLILEWDDERGFVEKQKDK